MSNWLIDALGRLSGRERWLLAGLVLVVLPLALWAGLMAPLQERRATALAELQEARRLSVWVEDRATEAALFARVAPVRASAPIGASGIEERLISAGLRDRLSGLSDRGDGTLELRFDSIGFAPLIDWLSTGEPVWGYRISSYRLERQEAPGMVAAELVLTPQP